MLVKTKAIVLSSIKYQEKSLIVKCFTFSDGLKSYFVRDAFSSKKGNQKVAYFQPLSILEIEAVHKNKGILESFKEIKIATPFATVHSDVIKSTIVMFLSEVLHHSIHEEEANESLFTFLETTLLWLDTHNEIFNFHLIFLLETSKYLGFYPDLSNIKFDFFDTVDGIFVPFLGTNCLSKHQTDLLKIALDLKFENVEKVFAAIERQVLLKIIVDYYSYHLDGFKKPKSLEVLKEVFS